MKRLTFLLLAFFLACEKDDETTGDETTPTGLASDEVAWLSVDISRLQWMVVGTDDSLRYTTLMPYWDIACSEGASSYTLCGDSLITNPDTENESFRSIALLDSGRILRQSWEDGATRWYWDSQLDEPTDCEAYAALAGMDREYRGSARLVQGEAPLDTLELEVLAENGFLWFYARAFDPTRLFQLGARAQPGAGILPLLAGAGAYKIDHTTYYLDNGLLALESFSTEAVAGVFTGQFYDSSTNPSGRYDADVFLRLGFEAIATPVEAAPPHWPLSLELSGQQVR